MTFEPIEHEPDDYELGDETVPSQPRGPGFARRFWRSLTGQRTRAEICRPVTITGDDGQPVHAAVLGGKPMSDDGRAAFAEIVRAAQRKHREDLRAARQAADDDVRAVARLLKLGDVSFLGTWLTDFDDAKSELATRFADRIAELEAHDAKARAGE